MQLLLLLLLTCNDCWGHSPPPLQKATSITLHPPTSSSPTFLIGGWSSPNLLILAFDDYWKHWLVDCLFVVYFVDQYPYGVWCLGQSMYETFTYDNVHVCALWSFAGMLVKKKVGSGVCNVILICILNLHFFSICCPSYSMISIQFEWQLMDLSFAASRLKYVWNPHLGFHEFFFPPHAYVCRGNHKHSQKNCFSSSLNNIVSGFINSASFCHGQSLHSEWSYINPLVLCNWTCDNV